jgi:catechol 2,3-dioxygenase-like lactoylglutathione lyase family enzyme
MFGCSKLSPAIDGRNAPRRSRVLTKAALGIILLSISIAGHAGVRAIGPIGLTVGDLDRELSFYTNTLPFRLVSFSEAKGQETDRLLGLKHTRLRVATLQLGDEFITFTEHLSRKGKAIPEDSQSFDHWFQHIAIVVSDMDQAYERLREQRVKQVSTGPQTLPDWNKNAAGIKAFYFRDPENHILEIIFFPRDKGDAKWQRLASQPNAPLFLGIDHTAIVVSDTARSLEFYRDLLGLRVAGASENYGTEQEHLNQVFGARLRITALRAEHGPGIEFLEYLSPPGGRVLPPDAKANDLIFWDTHLDVDEPSAVAMDLRQHDARFVSVPHTNATSFIVRDPDGHAIQVERENTAP